MAENFEEEPARAKALLHGLEYVATQDIDTRRDLADLLPESVARECNVLPQRASGNKLKVVMSDPVDFETIDRIRFQCGRPVVVALASPEALREAIDRVYATTDH